MSAQNIQKVEAAAKECGGAAAYLLRTVPRHRHKKAFLLLLHLLPLPTFASSLPPPQFSVVVLIPIKHKRRPRVPLLLFFSLAASPALL